MKYLITGGFGDIGSMLYKAYEKQGLEILHFDKQQNIQANRLLHLAAKSPPASVAQIIESNIVYLHEIADYAVRNGIGEIIFFSGAAIYGKQNKENVSEADPSLDADIYGLSKLFGEKLLEQTGLRILSLRLPAVLGMKNTTNFLARCYMRLIKGENIELTNAGRTFNNLIAVENIFHFLREVKLQKEYDTINLATAKEMTIIEIVNLMKHLLNSTSDIKISDAKNSFFNISTKKAELKYGFNPDSTALSIERWVHQRLKYEGNTA